MSFETITVEQRDAVTLITLNRPKALNALNSKVLEELIDAFAAYQADSSQLCAVLTGSELLRPGWIEVSGSAVTAVGAGSPPRPPDRDFSAMTVVPGFVDTHVHGGGGGSFSGGADHPITTTVPPPLCLRNIP